MYNTVNIVPIKSAVGIVSWLVFTNYTYILGKIFYVLNNYLERFIKYSVLADTMSDGKLFQLFIMFNIKKKKCILIRNNYHLLA